MALQGRLYHKRHHLSPSITIPNASELCVDFRQSWIEKKIRSSKLLLFLPTLLPRKTIPDELSLVHTQPFAAWRSCAQPGCSADQALSRASWLSSSECSVVDEQSDGLSAWPSASAEGRICCWHCCPTAIKLLLTADGNGCPSREG